MADSPELQLQRALVAARAEFPRIVETSNADAGKYSYTYASLGAIKEAVRPALDRHGLYLWHDVSDGHVHTHLLHVSGAKITASYAIKPGVPQDVGGQTTYYRRYGTGALLDIITERDDDATAASGRNTRTSTASRRRTRPHGGTPRGQKSVQHLWIAARAAGSAMGLDASEVEQAVRDYVLDKFRTESTRDLSPEQIEVAVSHFDAITKSNTPPEN